MRVVHFIEQLLDDGRATDQATGIGRLGNDQVANVIDLRNRKSHVGQVRNILESGIGIVRTGDLGAAFEQVSAYGALCQPVEFIGAPSKAVQQWSQRQRCIGGSPHQHDIGILSERRRDALGAKIDVRSQYWSVADVDAFERRLLPDLRFGHDRQQVIAGHGGYAQFIQTEPAGELQYPSSAANRVGGTHVGDNANAVTVAVGKHQRKVAVEERRVALIGVFASQALRDCQRAFREHFINQKAWTGQGGKGGDNRDCGVESVTGKASPAAYVYMRH